MVANTPYTVVNTPFTEVNPPFTVPTLHIYGSQHSIQKMRLRRNKSKMERRLRTRIYNQEATSDLSKRPTKGTPFIWQGTYHIQHHTPYKATSTPYKFTIAGRSSRPVAGSQGTSSAEVPAAQAAVEFVVVVVWYRLGNSGAWLRTRPLTGVAGCAVGTPCPTRNHFQHQWRPYGGSLRLQL